MAYTRGNNLVNPNLQGVSIEELRSRPYGIQEQETIDLIKKLVVQDARFAQLQKRQQARIALALLKEDKQRLMNQLERQLRRANTTKTARNAAVTQYTALRRLPAFYLYRNANDLLSLGRRAPLNARGIADVQQAFAAAYANMTNAQKKELNEWYNVEPRKLQVLANKYGLNNTKVNTRRMLAWQRRQAALARLQLNAPNGSVANVYTRARLQKAQQKNQAFQLNVPRSDDLLTNFMAAVLVAVHVNVVRKPKTKPSPAKILELVDEWKGQLSRELAKKAGDPVEQLRLVKNGARALLRGEGKQLRLAVSPDQPSPSELADPKQVIISYDPGSQTWTPMVFGDPSKMKVTDDLSAVRKILRIPPNNPIEEQKNSGPPVNTMSGQAAPTKSGLYTFRAKNNSNQLTPEERAAFTSTPGSGVIFNEEELGLTKAQKNKKRGVNLGRWFQQVEAAPRRNNTPNNANRNANVNANRNASRNNENFGLTKRQRGNVGGGGGGGGSGSTIWYTNNGDDRAFSMATPIAREGFIIGKQRLNGTEEGMWKAYLSGLLDLKLDAAHRVRDASFLVVARHRALDRVQEWVFDKPDGAKKACKANRDDDDALYRFMSRVERTLGCTDATGLRVIIPDGKRNLGGVGGVMFDRQQLKQAHTSAAKRARVLLGRVSIPLLVWTFRARDQAAMLRAYAMSRLAVCGRNPHFPMVYGAVTCLERKEYALVTESFHGTAALWLRTFQPAVHHVAVALVQVLLALASMHSRRLLHGNVSPHAVLMLNAAPSKDDKGRWHVYRVGNRDIALSTTGPLFALGDFSNTRVFPRGGAPAHCEVVRALQMFKAHLPRKPYKALTNFARAARLDAAMFLHHATVLQALASMMGGTGALRWDSRVPDGLRAYQKHDVLPQGYKPQPSSRGACDTAGSVLGALEELGRAARAQRW